MHSPRPAGRSIGRPRQGVGAAARELLLDAAVTLFSERGIAATTLAEIAARAGVTAAMVHYYFTNRDQLVDAIVEERLLPTVTDVWAPVDADTDVATMVRGLAKRIFKAAETNPWLPSLWVREILSEGGELRPRLVTKLPFQHILHMIDAVTAAQRRSEISPGIEPRLVVVSVLGLTMLPLALLRNFDQLPVLQGVKREDLERHAAALLASAFRKSASRRAKSI
jgi:TetR/AcrR family transcriptional regulator